MNDDHNRAICTSATEALNLAKMLDMDCKVFLFTDSGNICRITVSPDGTWINEDREEMGD